MPQGGQLIMNRTGVYSNNMQGQGIILEDSRLNSPSCCYMKRVIFKIHSKNDVVCVLRKHSKNQDLLFLILLCPQVVLTCFFLCLKNDNQGLV